MQWLWSHPYTIAMIATGIILLGGIFIVTRRSAVGPDGSTTRVWGGIGNALFNPTANTSGSTDRPRDLYTSVQQGPPFTWTPTQGSDAENAPDQFDLDAFLQELAQPSGTAGTSAGLSLDAYSFIPQGLISTNTTPQKQLTESQSALYTYGNEAGSAIQSFEETHRNMPQVLKDQFEDPESEVKRGRLLELAGSLARVGNELSNIESVPAQAASANRNMAESYKEIGAKLALIPSATGEQALLDAMLTYNAAVEKFVKNYVALATLFSISGVTFRSDEAGSVFMFSSGATL